MITFRDSIRHEATVEKIERLARSARLGDTVTLYHEAGELEQGVLDALYPHHDGWDERARRLRTLSYTASVAYYAARSGESIQRYLPATRHALDEVTRLELPRALEIRAPEGYAHYALDPIGYAGAADRYRREVGARHARRAVVVGVRSIGTSLSGIVAARLSVGTDPDSADATNSESKLCMTHSARGVAAEGHPIRSVTIRPRGRSGARRVMTDAPLYDTIRQWLSDGGDLLIVDEGPGATGETFRCVAEWAGDLGVSAHRVILFPSHLGLPGLGDPETCDFLEQSRRYAPPIGDGRVERLCTRLGLSSPRNLSAGRWRAAVPGARHAPAIPNHERLKFHAHDGEGRTIAIRYTGIGRSGAEVLDRAQRLDSKGIGPVVVGHAAGFTLSEWTEGHALGHEDPVRPTLLQAVADYLRTRTSLFRTGQSVELEPIIAMLYENTTETFSGRPMYDHRRLRSQSGATHAIRQPEDEGALHSPPSGLSGAIHALESLPTREAVIADARLQRHEWIQTPTGYTKVDAIEHGDGIRLPGPTDPAWDLAGAVIEFGLNTSEQDELIRLCTVSDSLNALGTPSSPVGRAELATWSAAVHAYRAPYAACQLGETVLGAREATNEADRRRLEREAERYRRTLWRELARWATTHPPSSARRGPHPHATSVKRATHTDPWS